MVCATIPSHADIHSFVAVQDMEPGELIFMEDFTLYEAMSAFEVRKNLIMGWGFC